jgi:hypothetical protein
MFTGPPLPLTLDIPIQQLLALTDAIPAAGAWVREGPRELRVRLSGQRRRARILISRDLGLLLRRCRNIVLRAGSEVVMLQAHTIIRWRALQVVTGTPCLPHPGLLKEMFPGVSYETQGFSVPVGDQTPEEVLSECLSHGVPVQASRIVYDSRPRPTPSG